MTSQVAWFIGLVTFICVALTGQADQMIGEPYHHWLAVGGLIGTAISGYMLQHPWQGNERRAETSTLTVKLPTDSENTP